MKKIIPLLIILCFPAIAQNTDKATTRLTQQDVLFNSYETTEEVLRTRPVEPNLFYGKDSLYFGTPGDSTSDITPDFVYGAMYLTAYDTLVGEANEALLDSLLGFYYNPNLALWDTLKFIDSDGNRVKILTGVSGSIKTWKADLIRPYRVKVVLINYRDAYLTRKSYISWSGRNE
jgi:hypothetical protein